MILLEEADMRIRRAGEHLLELDIELLRFERLRVGEVLTGLPKGHPNGEGEQEKFVNLIGLDLSDLFSLKRKPPEIPPLIPILIGEAAYNLVASLDYLTFALAFHDSGREQSGTQFPVFQTKGHFERGRFSMLKGIASKHVALIERLQPYQGCTWTQRLKELSNLDKHRHLLRVDSIPLMITGSHPDSPSERAKEARARRRAKLPKPPVKMYYGRAFLVMFSDRSRIAETLQVLQSQVTDVLVQFKTLLG